MNVTIVLDRTIEAVVKHRNETLFFNLSKFTRKPFTQDFEVMDYFNRYLTTLTGDEQDRLFHHYQVLHEVINTSWEYSVLSARLVEPVRQVLDDPIFHHDRVRYWIVYHSDILIPEGFAETYVHDIDKQFTREKSYTKQDYLDLLVVALVARVMLPVWGEYLNKTYDELRPKFRDYYAYLVGATSQFYESPGMVKLTAYIEANVERFSENAYYVMDGISSEEFVDWMKGSVLIKRLALGDLRGNSPDIDLVKFVYKHILQKSQDEKNKKSQVIRDKTPTTSAPVSEDTEIYSLEKYRINSSISQGKIVELETLVDDVFSVATKILPSLPYPLYQQCLENMKPFVSKRYLSPHQKLIGWVYASQIPPRAIEYYNRNKLIELAAGAQAILWHQAFPYLALFLSTFNMPDQGHYLLDTEDQYPITDAMLTELNHHFSYPLVIGSGKSKKGRIEVNPVIQAIQTFISELKQAELVISAPTEWVKQVFNTYSTTFPISYNRFKYELVKLILMLETTGDKP